MSGKKVVPVRGHARRIKCTESAILKMPPRREVVDDDRESEGAEAPAEENGGAGDEGEPEEA